MKKYLSSLIILIGLALSSNVIACNNAASCWSSGLAQHKAKNYAGAASYFIKSCNYGKKKSCSAAGDMSKKIRNFRNAEIYLTKACNFGEKIGCNWLGDLFIEKKGKNINKGLSYKAKACNMGHIGSCVTAGNLYLEREQYAQARPMFQKACYNNKDKVGVAEGCNQLGHLIVLLSSGTNVNDHKKRVALYKKGCEANAPAGFSKVPCRNYKELKALLDKIDALDGIVSRALMNEVSMIGGVLESKGYTNVEEYRTSTSSSGTNGSEPNNYIPGRGYYRPGQGHGHKSQH